MPPDGRLPDRAALSKALLRAGQQFSIRGIEATVEGWLERREGQPVLQVEGWEQPLVLAALTSKVQWARSRKQLAEPTPEERSAYDRLLEGWDGTPRRVRITGPVRLPATALRTNQAKNIGSDPSPSFPESPAVTQTTLEVRAFAFLVLPATASPAP